MNIMGWVAIIGIMLIFIFREVNNNVTINNLEVELDETKEHYENLYQDYFAIVKHSSVKELAEKIYDHRQLGKTFIFNGKCFERI